MKTLEENMTSAQQPEELHRLFVSGVNAHDIEALMALYEHDCAGADLEGHLVQGADSMRTFLSGFLAVVKQLDGETRKALVAGNLALLSSSWHAVIAIPGGETISVAGTSAEVARRQPDGTWRFLLDDPQFVNVPAQSEHV